MINVSFDLKDKKAARLFGRAIIDYAGEDETVVGDTPVPFIGPKDLTDPPPVKLPAEVLKNPLADGETVEPTPQIHGGGTGEPTAAAPDVDGNGVPFDKEFCGKAKIPFYASGKNKGQWKRRQGTDEKAYDAWYASEHIKVQTGPATRIKPVAPDTAAAFGATGEVAEVDDDRPTGAGELFKWVSEQMNAGHLTQPEVDSAYVTAGVTPGDLFTAGADTAVAAVYDVLNALVSA